jgi:hypothetical protein
MIWLIGMIKYDCRAGEKIIVQDKIMSPFLGLDRCGHLFGLQ